AFVDRRARGHLAARSAAGSRVIPELAQTPDQLRQFRIRIPRPDGLFRYRERLAVALLSKLRVGCQRSFSSPVARVRRFGLRDYRIDILSLQHLSSQKF